VRFDTISLSVPVPYMVEAAVEGSDPAAGINPDAAAAMGSVDETNFYTLTAQFGITGAYAAVIDAIALLQSNPRFVLVHGVSIDEGLAAGDAPVSASLDGQLFLLLERVRCSFRPPIPEAAGGRGQPRAGVIAVKTRHATSPAYGGVASMGFAQSGGLRRAFDD
jgi:hypothetical protein